MTDGNGNGNGHRGDDQAPTAMTAEQFAAYLEKRLTLHDEIKVIGRQGIQLQLGLPGAETTMDIRAFYAAYARDPAQLDVVVQNFVEAVLDMIPDRSTSDYAALVDRIYPMLKPIELLVAVRERNLPMLAYREFLADLIVTYVVGEERSVAFINEDHLEHWSVSVQDLHARALENLRRRTHDRVDYAAAGTGEQRIFIFNSRDGYDAARLLLTEILADWAREMPGNIVIGIPNRDFLVAFSDANPEILRGLAQQVQADAASREYGLTDQLFTLAGGVLQEYVWE